MPDNVASGTANASGVAIVRVGHNRSGIIWVVSQMNVRSNPSRPAATARVTRNGQELMTTSILPATAGGYPFYRLTSSDVFEITFSGLTSGDAAIVTTSYEEGLWGEPVTGNVV